MPNFEPGQTVKVWCQVNSGAFPTEYFVSLDAVPEPVSGFVKRDDVTVKEGESTGFIMGTITDVSPDTISVRIQGSFFTTTGLTSIPREKADETLELIGK